MIPAAYVLGQSSFNTSNSATSATGFSGPIGVTFDPVHGRLFVADNVNARFLMFDATTLSNGAAARNVIGSSDLVTAWAGLTSKQVEKAGAVVVDPTGATLNAADSSKSRLLLFSVYP